MRMSVKQLRAFLAVAHTLNFAHASERLNLSQPALSLTIKALEDALGGPLLQRSTRKVALTQEGETFLPMARQLLADWDNVEEAMHQCFTLQRGKISVAAMPSFAANVLPEVCCHRAERVLAGRQEAPVMGRAADAGFHHPAAPVGGSSDDGGGAGAKRQKAGRGAGESSAGDGRANGRERAGRQCRPGALRGADDGAGRGLYPAG
ncbi:hypothetical protein L1887_44895 [Cichorium endivia]|nr:hypothetical protein L1887_44895 [Cichorium endivia]